MCVYGLHHSMRLALTSIIVCTDADIIIVSKKYFKHPSLFPSPTNQSTNLIQYSMSNTKEISLSHTLAGTGIRSYKYL